MATIDDKVVAMTFESSKFESGVNTAISSLDKLKAALHFPNAGKGLDDINTSAKRIDLSHIGAGVDTVISKLGALRLSAIAVFAQVEAKAVQMGINLAKSLTIQPMKAGFQEYSTNLNAIQTILANTQASGAKLKDVNKALQELNTYSDKTIYNFSQMAKNIGTFTAAGVDLKTSTASIKGIANLAALSGSNADQASTAMYQLSQAIAAGSVKLQDWNSVVNAGMGGTVFQRALAETAQQMGTLKEGTVKLTGPMKNVTIAGEAFRQSLSTPGKASWLTSDVLTKTLKHFTGDLTDAQLKAEGFNASQIKAIQQTAKTAMHAATEVKTLSQVLDVAKETAGSGWAQTWQIIFGNFVEAKTTFTALSNAVNGIINSSSKARNKVLADWKALGGRTILINSIKEAFHNLGLVVGSLKSAFRDIFPPATGKGLLDLTLKFRDFAKALKPSQDTLDNLHRTFRGLFAVLDIGVQIVKGFYTITGQLFGAMHDGSGGFLDFTARVGDWLVALDKALKKGDKLHNFFVVLGQALAVPLKVISALAGALSNLFSGFSPGGFSHKMDGMTGSMNPFQKLMQSVVDLAPKVVSGLGDVGRALKPALDAYISLLHGLGTAIGQAASNMNFDAILQVLRTGLFGGLVIMLRKFFGKGAAIDQIFKGFQGLTGGVLKNISGSFKALEGSAVAMQQNIKAKTMKEIAIAIGILAASMVALSFVDPKKLNVAMGGMTVAFGELLGAMAVLNKIAVTAGFIKLPIVAAGLVILAGAIDVLTVAVLAMSFLSWESLLKGLGGVAALMGTLVAAVIPLSKGSAGMIRAGVGITGIAIGLNILALAVRQMGGLDLQSLGKGLAGVAVGLTAITIAMNKMPVSKGMVANGIALIAMGTGLRILATAVAAFGKMDVVTMAKGLIGVGVALGAIALAMKIMPKGMVLQAAALVIVSGALNQIVKAVSTFGQMSLMEIAKGLGVFAYSLAALVASVYLMEGAIGGAIALGIVAASMGVLAPALALLGKQSWTQIIKGLVALAAALTIFAVAGVLIDAAIPGLLALGVAMLLIGAGFALVGAGIFLISTGFAALVVGVQTGAGIMVASIIAFEQGMIKVAKNLVLGILEIVKAFADAAPKFVDALVKIVNSLVDGVIQVLPKVSVLFQALLDTVLKLLHDNQTPIIQAGFDLLVALLEGIKKNIPTLVNLVFDIVGKFLSAIASRIGTIVTAGEKILKALLKGITDHIATVTTIVLSIVTKFLGVIASNLGKIVTAGGNILVKLIEGITKNVKNLITAGTNLIVAFINGIGNAGPRIINAAVNAMTKFINALSNAGVKLVDEGAKAIVRFLNGVANAIDAHAHEIRAAGVRVGTALINGLTGGLTAKARELYDKISGIMGKAMSLIHKIPFVNSPSKVTTEVGKNIVLGLVKGIDDTKTDLYASATAISKGTIKVFNDIFQTASPSKVMYQIGKFVGQGFANGLRGSADDIRKAFTDLNNKLNEQMISLRETIKKEQDRLDKLRAAKKPDADAIKAAEKALYESEAALKRITASHAALTGVLQKNKAQLIAYANQYDHLTDLLKDKKGKLADAIKTRDDAIANYEAQYSTLPTEAYDLAKIISDATDKVAEAQANLNKVLADTASTADDIATAQKSLAEAQKALSDATAGQPLTAAGQLDVLQKYMNDLKDKVAAVQIYNETLEKLKALGLDDATYQKLVDEGVAGQQFADALLAGGETAIEGINALDAELKKASDVLGVNAGNNLYQAGVDAAQGVVDGLESKRQAIRDKVNQIAKDITDTLNAALKVASPSKVMYGIGEFVMMGLANGMSDSSKMVTDAVEGVADDAVSAMQRSLRGIHDAVASELDSSPVITPILDLTYIRSQSAELSALTRTGLISAASYDQASIISAQQTASQVEGTTVAPGGTSLKFEQNNYSPAALSEVEIYRQTRNQLSQIKSALALS